MAGQDEPPVETLGTLAEKMPGVPPETIEAAVAHFVAAGILTEEAGPEGERRFRYTNPEKYRLIDVPVIRQPGPDFGRR